MEKEKKKKGGSKLPPAREDLSAYIVPPARSIFYSPHLGATKVYNLYTWCMYLYSSRFMHFLMRLV